jgi:hypothetical protein
MNKKQQVLNWLASINETDQAVIDDTLRRCRSDQEVLQYFLKRSTEAL